MKQRCELGSEPDDVRHQDLDDGHVGVWVGVVADGEADELASGCVDKKRARLSGVSASAQNALVHGVRSCCRATAVAVSFSDIGLNH